MCSTNSFRGSLQATMGTCKVGQAASMPAIRHPMRHHEIWSSGTSALRYPGLLGNSDPVMSSTCAVLCGVCRPRYTVQLTAALALGYTPTDQKRRTSQIMNEVVYRHCSRGKQQRVKQQKVINAAHQRSRVTPVLSAIRCLSQLDV